MATTSKPEQEAIREKRGPRVGERIVRYRLFLTDGFAENSGQLDFLVNQGVPARIDGFENDDSYRQSRHLLQWSVANETEAASNWVESSLARQIAAKEDQPATIRLVRRIKQSEYRSKNPEEDRKPWRNLIPPNTKFFLEQVQENREEKVQVIDTFGEWIAFFFGRRPEVYTYAGTLLNAKNHDWKNEFQENYEHFLRGSQAVKNRATMILQYDDVVVEGYMMNCAISQDATNSNSVGFRFNLLVINRSPVNPRQLLQLRILRSGSTDLEDQLFANMNAALNLTQAGRLDELETFFIMREYFAGNYFPGAGIAQHTEDTNKVTTTETTYPGVTSGLRLAPASSTTLNLTFSDKIEASGANEDS